MSDEAQKEPGASAVAAAEKLADAVTKAAGGEDEKPKPAVAVTVLQPTRLRAGQKIFQARGVSSLKVSQPDGSILRIDLPIRAVALDEVENALASSRPTPPSRRAPVEAGSDAARDYNVPGGGLFTIFDAAHPDYVRKKEAWDDQIAWGVVALGVEVDVEDSNGKLAKTVDERIRALKELGLSPVHFAKVNGDIFSLTSLRQREMVDFFAAKPASSPGNPGATAGPDHGGSLPTK
jgi:translation elongation factor EF-1beta